MASVAYMNHTVVVLNGERAHVALADSHRSHSVVLVTKGGVVAALLLQQHHSLSLCKVTAAALVTVPLSNGAVRASSKGNRLKDDWCYYGTVVCLQHDQRLSLFATATVSLHAALSNNWHNY
eukprot:12648-Heterococcus_DN1.PRE.4